MNGTANFKQLVHHEYAYNVIGVSHLKLYSRLYFNTVYRSVVCQPAKYFVSLSVMDLDQV